MELARGERRKIALAQLALEDLVGEAEVRTHKFVGEHFARRRGGKQGMQAKRAAEDGFVIGDAPFAQLSLDAGGRILDQQSGETLEADSTGQGLLIAVGEFETLFDPARQVLSDIEEHAKFGVTPVEKRAVQVLA